MDWSLAIDRNRSALLAVVAAIAALLGGAGDGARDGAGLIARRLRHAALALLRPAESATRRLIILAARGLVLSPRPAPVFAGPIGSGAKAVRAPAFRLFDRPKRLPRHIPLVPPRGIPRIRSLFGPPLVFSPPAPVPPAKPAPSPLVEVGRLRRRLAALQRALATLPRQARRLARWRARVTPRRSPLRLGPLRACASGQGARSTACCANATRWRRMCWRIRPDIRAKRAGLSPPHPQGSADARRCRSPPPARGRPGGGQPRFRIERRAGPSPTLRSPGREERRAKR